MYKRILDFWMNERELKDLQKITPEFRDEVKHYVEELGRIENGEPLGLRSAEAGRVKQMLGEISALRREKACMVKIAETALDILPDEDLTMPQQSGESVKPKDDGAKKILVRLLRDVASFVGADLKTYGPFKSEDVVLLPAQNADALIKRGIAAEIQRKV
jgi:DNA replication initiation complex subunit (GINS family)